MAQKVGRREKLAQKVGRREICPPVPPPSKLSSPQSLSLRSKRFRRVWEQRKTEERSFRYFACAENGARAKNRTVGVGEGREGISSPCNSLLPNCTETLARQAGKASVQ